MIGLILILFFIAGVCNAVQDTIAHHWGRSVFARIGSEFWYKWFRSWWLDKPAHPIWFLWDGWHFFKTVEKLCYILIIYIVFGWVTALISGVISGIGFNLFYKRLLLRDRD